MKKSMLSILLLAMVLILTISAASAANIEDSTDLATIDDDSTALGAIDSKELQTASDSEILADSVDGNNFTTLQNMINEDGVDEITIDKDYTRADGDSDIEINKDFTIKSENNNKIDANNLGRIFKVTSGKTLTLIGLTLINGNAEYGGAIYADASILVLNNCILDSNNVFDLTSSNPNELGGAAIHAVDSTVNITDSSITNNGDKTLDRSNDQVINGAVNLINSNTVITGSLFENNTGIYGGAVFAKGGSLQVSDSQFIKNTAYVGAGIRTEGTTLTVTSSKFEENEGRGTGSAGTSKNAGAAICSKGVGTIIIASSNFTKNTAENGGAINTNVISSSNTVTIDNCVFTDNSATEKGGAILVNNDAVETMISNSNFTGNDCDSGSAIYNGGILSLSKNSIDKSGAIVNNNVINSNVIITVLDNKSATYNVYDKIEDFYAQLTDNKGNVIVTADKILKIGFGTSVLNLEYDETDGLYHKANVKVVKSGAPSLRSETKKLFTDITFNSPYLTAIKLNATLEVKYENVSENDDVVINITLTGKEGETAISNTSSSIFTVTVNNVPHPVKITKGKGSLTISDLLVGDYVINASWTGNTYYNHIEKLYDLTVSPKKGTFTELKYLIDNNKAEVLVLPYDFAYDDEYDVELIDGIVIDKNIAIDANGVTINGKNIARLFKVDSDKNFTLNNASLVNGNADSGSAIYNEGTVHLSNSTFTGNVAIDDSVIYNKGTLSLNHNTIDEGLIFSSGKVISLVTTIFNNKQAINCKAFDTINFTVKFVDDMNNTIRFNVNSLRVYVGNKGNPLTTLTLNKTTGVYSGSEVATVGGQMHLENEGRYFVDNYVVNNNFKRTGTPVNMEKANATLTVKYENITYPGDVVINVTLTGHDGVGLNCPAIFFPAFNIWVNDTKKAVAISNGAGQLSVSDLAAGEYKIIAKFNGDKTYNAIEQEYKLVISPIATTLTVSVDNIEYGKNATVNVTLKDNSGKDMNGTVTVIINNEPYLIDVVNGIGSINNISGLAAKENYQAEAFFKAIGNYSGSTATDLFNVSKIAPLITVSAVGVTYPGDVVVTVVSDVAGDVTVKVGDKNATDTVEAGVAKEFSISGLAAKDNYVIVASLPASENYTDGINDTETVNVSKATPVISVSASDVNYPDNVTVKVTSDVAGTYVVKVGDSAPQEITLEAGVAKEVNFTGLAVNEEGYVVNVTCAATENNTDAVNDTVKVKVKKIDTPVEINITKPVDGENATVTVTVPKEAGGNVTVQVGEKTYNSTVDENGTATVNVPDLPAGDNNVTVTYTPSNDNYASKTNKTTIHVKKLLVEANNMTRGYNSGMDYEAKLVDEDGNPVENKTLIFTINGKQYNATTDADGLAKINPVLAVGNYDVNVTGPTGESVNATLDIVKRTSAKDLVMDYKDGSKFKVRVIGDDGKPVGADVTVKVTVNGKTYTVKTDKKGYAYLPINLMPKKYTITSVYKADKTKNKITVKSTIKVKKTVKVKKTAKKLVLKATLKWSNGKAIKNKKVVFKFKGKKYNAKTNSKGIAKVTIKKNVIKKLKKGKKYNFSARYVYESAFGKVQVR